MPCAHCGRVQVDPVKGASPWVRAVARGNQILVCPDCQKRSEWESRVDRCPVCGGTRLSISLGVVTCRGCGKSFDR